jgi:hypothetical protein
MDIFARLIELKPGSADRVEAWAHGAVLVIAINNLRWVRGGDLLKAYKHHRAITPHFALCVVLPLRKTRAGKVYLIPGNSVLHFSGAAA